MLLDSYWTFDQSVRKFPEWMRTIKKELSEPNKLTKWGKAKSTVVEIAAFLLHFEAHESIKLLWDVINVIKLLYIDPQLRLH